jgi:hypothetical protein
MSVHPSLVQSNSDDLFTMTMLSRLKLDTSLLPSV